MNEYEEMMDLARRLQAQIERVAISHDPVTGRQIPASLLCFLAESDDLEEDDPAEEDDDSGDDLDRGEWDEDCDHEDDDPAEDDGQC